jgi:hypothetical protein
VGNRIPSIPVVLLAKGDPKKTKGGCGMIRELVVALVFLSLAVTAAMWLGGAPRLAVDSIEASVAVR